MDRWKRCVNKLSHKSLPGMDDVFTYVEGGTNTFMPDTKDVQLPGKVGLKAIGGVMKHLRALTAIGSSTVNSYRRLWDHRFLGSSICRLGISK